MIRIQRPQEVPQILQTVGARKTIENCAKFDRHTDDQRETSDILDFDFDRHVYSHESVKKALLEAQYKKCCYCETKIRRHYGAIEHFRPKGAVQQSPDGELKYPGYFWLAYCWSNLLVSCSVCNTTYKRNLFPLKDDAERARNHHDDLGTERPLLVDPSGEDPRQHIRFRRAEAYHLTEKGRVTIETLGLGESGLDEARRERLEHLEALRCIVEMEDGPGIEYIELAQTQLNMAVLPNAKFCSMARDFLDAGAGGGEGG